MRGSSSAISKSEKIQALKRSIGFLHINFPADSGCMAAQESSWHSDPSFRLRATLCDVGDRGAPFWAEALLPPSLWNTVFCSAYGKLAAAGLGF